MQKSEPAQVAPKKPKVVRVVTASEVVPWHLHNTLKRMTADFDVCVVGQGVSAYQDQYPYVQWVDLELNRKISLMSDLIAVVDLCRFFVRYKPDIVHSIMPKAGLLTALAGFICRVPVRLHTFTGQVWATKTGLARFLLKAIDKLISVLNTVCLTDSPSQSQFLYENSIGLHGKPLPVLGKGSLSGVDLTRFNETDLTAAERLRQSIGLSPQDFVFAFVARKSQDKGALDIIQAFAKVSQRHPECKLLFVGPDESQGKLAQLKSTQPSLFNQVFDVGRVDNHEQYLAVSHVLCLPSYREGFGTIVIDAAALGVPTIGSAIVGLVDSIEDGKTGILFPAGDLDKLVSAMLSFVENPKQLETMGSASKQRVKDFFSADFLYSALKDCYVKLLEGAKK